MRMGCVPYSLKHTASQESDKQNKETTQRKESSVPCSAIICAKPWKDKEGERESDREHWIPILIGIVMIDAFSKKGKHDIWTPLGDLKLPGADQEASS